jgi:hypothetical protein
MVMSILSRFFKLYILFLYVSNIYAQNIYIPKKLSKKYTDTLQTNLYSANDMVGVFDFYKDWDGEYSPNSSKNIAILYGYTSYTKSLDSYDISFIHRVEAVTNASKDTIDILYQDKKDLPYTKDKVYDIELKIDGFEALGLGGSFEYKSDSFKDMVFYVNGYLLYGLRSQDGYIKGNMMVNSDNEYIYDAYIDYIYSKNYLYDLDIPSAKGYGYSFDLLVYYDLSNSLELSFMAQDIIGAIYWENISYTSAKAKSTINDNTKLFKDPSIYGVEKSSSWKQDIVKKYQAGAKYTLVENIFVDLKLTDFYDVVYKNISCELDSSYGTFLFGYEDRFETFDIGYESELQSFSLELQSQTLDIYQSKAFGVSLLYGFSF